MNEFNDKKQNQLNNLLLFIQLFFYFVQIFNVFFKTSRQLGN